MYNVGNGRSFKKIPPEVLLKAEQKLDEILNILKPYLAAAAPEKEQAPDENTAHKGSELIKFLKLSHELAVETPELFPDFADKTEFKEDFFTANELWILAGKIDVLKEKLSSMEILAARRALEIALMFYQTVKIAARYDIPGARVIFDDLKTAFPSGTKGRRRPKVKTDDGQLELFG